MATPPSAQRRGRAVRGADARAARCCPCSYLFLRDLWHADEACFFRLLFAHAEELLPLVYTPTVGDAASSYHRLRLAPHGLLLSRDQGGSLAAGLARWPAPPGVGDDAVAVVVLTDGGRVLGLGDLGANGLAISEGKCLLYTLFGGVAPHRCLPLCLDVGTDNVGLREDPAYGGSRSPRLAGARYDALLDELLAALWRRWPGCLVQFEDFPTGAAFSLLARHGPARLCFNDDIQGTAAVALAGLLAALGAAGVAPASARLLFFGAGEAGTGAALLFAAHLEARHGVPRARARAACVLVDSRGVLWAGRGDAGTLPDHKRPWAHPAGALPPALSELLKKQQQQGLRGPSGPPLAEVVAALRPHALVGASAQPGAFTPAVLAALAAGGGRVVLPLSNPTALSECTAEAAAAALGPRLLFASGSPFPPLRLPGGRLLRPSQANNVFVFPGVGVGGLACAGRSLPQGAFLAAAEALAALLPPSALADGQLFPPAGDARRCAAAVAGAVAAHLVGAGLGAAPPRLGGPAARPAPAEWARDAEARAWAPPPAARL